MSTGYEAGGYGSSIWTARSPIAAGVPETPPRDCRQSDLILASRPAPAQVAVVFNPLVPLLGGEQAYGDRRAIHRAVAGYHRMFFERNIDVDVPSARELTAKTSGGMPRDRALPDPDDRDMAAASSNT